METIIVNDLRKPLIELLKELMAMHYSPDLIEQLCNMLQIMTVSERKIMLSEMKILCNQNLTENEFYSQMSKTFKTIKGYAC